MPMPYLGRQITIEQPDGSTLAVRVFGNQFGAVLETLDGYTIVRDQESGQFRYARVSADGTSLEPDGLVGAVDPAAIGLRPHARIAAPVAASRARRARDSRTPTRWEERRRRRRAQLRAAAADATRPAPPPNTTVGDYVGLCLLVEFPDVGHTIEQDEVDRFCNEPGYTGFGNNGSVYDYFFDVSSGQFRYTNVVTAYYTATQPREYYTDPAIEYGSRARELIVEALTSLTTAGFDFSALSADAGGYIYALNVFYGGEIVNGWAEGLWPHSWSLETPYDVGGGRQLFDYQITNMGSSLTLGTFCHENGHMVCDFPDLYDYGYESSGVGQYCLMCYGGTDTNPTQVSAYLKHAAGWTTSVTSLDPNVAVSLTAGQNEFALFERNDTEYFIVENRQQVGRDAALPDSGLAIWHVDEVGSNGNEQMTPDMHYELSLEQADGRFDLEHGANVGDTDDLYDNVAANAFGDTSAPGSQWWDGTSSGLAIDSVSASDVVMTLTTTGGGGDDGGGVIGRSVVGVWEIVGITWEGDPGTYQTGPFTFREDGTWSYCWGNGTWFQYGDTVVWQFCGSPDLVYTATVQDQAMVGVMGYVGTPWRGSCYALRSLPSAQAAGAPQHTGVPTGNTDPFRGPLT